MQDELNEMTTDSELMDQPATVNSPPLDFPLRLSQTQLSLLSTCPRKFQHVYLEQLAVPADYEQQERQSQGSRFHLLMQQWQLGLPVEPLLQGDAQLQQWFTAFISAAPEIFALGGDASGLRQSEHTRMLEFDGYLLTAIYDLLITTDRQAKILDWKTYARPRNARWLVQNWQTRLYPFLLAETSAYAPEQISMTYWFFQAQAEGEAAQQLTIAYDSAKHEQTRRDLTQLLHQLTGWLERYQAGEWLPQLAATAPECEQCNFSVKCDRLASPDENYPESADENPLESAIDLSNPDPLVSLAGIQEIPL